MRASKPTSVHIYPLSRLVHGSPSEWDRHIKAIEEGKRIAFNYYHPLREAVALYCKSKGRHYNEATHLIETKARGVPAAKSADPLRDNRDAFDSFVTNFYPRIHSFKKSFLSAEEDGCPFGNIDLVGSPHYLVGDQAEVDRYVVLLPSKWERADTNAYLELLAVIIQQRYGATAQSLWCMDLRSGRDFTWKSSPRLRARCEKTAAVYARLVKTLSPTI